jgi:hypothetical protein
MTFNIFATTHYSLGKNPVVITTTVSSIAKIPIVVSTDHNI